jgi:uncharacterized membrane protein YeaQ/YmgE (transglycosylase-associated protein family)
MGILAWILFGLIAGAIAQLILPGNDPGGNSAMGWLITIVIGIVGAFIGGLIGSALGFGGVTGFNIGSFIIAIVGALILLGIWRWVAGRSGGGRHGYA